MSADDNLAGMPPGTILQVAAIYLAAAKVDANRQQAERLSRIRGPADLSRTTAADGQRIVTAVKDVMGGAWKLDAAWGRRLIAVVNAGTITEGDA